MTIRIFLSLALLWSFNTAAAQKHRLLPAQQFAIEIKKQHIQLLDVRTSQEFRNGFIPGALHADWLEKKQFNDRVSHLDVDRPLYIYCASGGRSSEAARALTQKGFSVIELEGGTNRWRKEKLPIESPEIVKELTLFDYKSMIPAKGFVMIDFGGPWCPPCRKMEPVKRDLLQSHPNITQLNIDPSTHSKLAEQLNVNELPTFIFYKDGREISRLTGIITAKTVISQFR